MIKQDLICSFKGRTKTVLLAMIANSRKKLKFTSTMLCTACDLKIWEVEAGKLKVQGYKESSRLVCIT